MESQLQMLHDCKVLEETQNIFVKLFSRAKTGKDFTNKSVWWWQNCLQSRSCYPCHIFQFSSFPGFEMRNTLRAMGDFNFYVSSLFYGPVEIIHLWLCHCIIDSIIQQKSGSF